MYRQENFKKQNKNHIRYNLANEKRSIHGEYEKLRDGFFYDSTNINTLPYIFDNIIYNMECRKEEIDNRYSRIRLLNVTTKFSIPFEFHPSENLNRLFKNGSIGIIIQTKYGTKEYRMKCINNKYFIG
jgi:hypothetical protein